LNQKNAKHFRSAIPWGNLSGTLVTLIDTRFMAVMIRR
jgi:hypothetical protein